MRQSLVVSLALGLVYSYTPLAYSSFARQVSGPRCLTPDYKQGTCINIRLCPAILELIRSNRNRQQATDFIRRSGCGYDPQFPMIPLVCCPSFAQDYLNLPSPPYCGRTEVWDHDKIVGGSPSELGAWPWIAALGYWSNKNPGPSWKCGGALVTKRYVVTAAHCAFPPGWRLYLVRLGESNLDGHVNDGANPIDIIVENIVTHEAYSQRASNDDIALIQLREEVPFSTYIQPICLPKTQELREKNFTGYSPFVAGWGATQFGGSISKELREVRVPIVEYQYCREKYISKGAAISQNQLCAGYDIGGKDSCQGDSGGPMMWPKSNYYYLLGVVSFGVGCATPDYPGVYTRVTEYVDWISKHIVV